MKQQMIMKLLLLPGAKPERVWMQSSQTAERLIQRTGHLLMYSTSYFQTESQYISHSFMLSMRIEFYFGKRNSSCHIAYFPIKLNTLPQQSDMVN